MAKVGAMPDRATILAFRGAVDFYCWKGIFVARRWPKKSTQPRLAGEVRSSEEFAVVAVATTSVSSTVKELFQKYPAGVGVTWVDMFRSYARGKPWVG